ncbi:hypothetical protein [Lysobacter sp. HA35]
MGPEVAIAGFLSLAGLVLFAAFAIVAFTPGGKRSSRLAFVVAAVVGLLLAARQDLSSSVHPGQHFAFIFFGCFALVGTPIVLAERLVRLVRRSHT